MLRTPVLDRTVAAVLERHVAVRPDKVAVLDEQGHSLTYAQLQETGLRVGASLRQLGVASHEFVVFMLDNHVDTVVTWAALGLSATVGVPVNAAYKGDMLTYVVAHSGARVAIIEGHYCSRFSAVRGSLPHLTTVVVRGEPDAPIPDVDTIPFESLLEADPSVGADPSRVEPGGVSDTALLLYTSGTEGPSKGVLVSHGHAFGISSSYPWDTEADDVVLVALPLFHASGLLAGVYNGLRGGATVILRSGFSVSSFWSIVRDHGCTQTLLMGAMAEFLWRREPNQDDRNHTLRNVTVVPAPAYVAEFAQRFGLNVSTSYGSAEVGTAAITPLAEMAPSVAGRPRSFIELRVVDDDDVEVPRGQVGELVVRSREPWTLMQGYHRMADVTVRAWRNLWLHTGDACYEDESGRFFFVDRKKDALRRRGENVSSIEVETAILKHPGIAAAAIVAVPSEFTEDDIKAYVVAADGAELDPAALLRDLAERLPYFMVPRYYEAIDALPMTPTHKVRKVELRQAGITAATWDCEANGFTITRHGLLATTLDARI